MAAMLLRRLSGIFAVTFLPLGIAFTALGLAVDHPDSGSPEAFLYVGASLGVLGVVCAGVFLVAWRREAGRRRRRRAGVRAAAEVVRADVMQGVRVGSSLAVKLTVRVGGDTVTRTVLRSPWEPVRVGDRVQIVYDPSEPGNFETV
jgi:hypothetical protein